MTSVWHWIVPGGIGAVIGSAATEAFRWFYPNHRDWEVERKARTEREIDAKVRRAMGDRTLWNGPRLMTGSGLPVAKSDEVAEYLKLGQDAVADSFERMEERGHAKRSSGSFDDPAPWWFILPR